MDDDKVVQHGQNKRQLKQSDKDLQKRKDTLSKIESCAEIDTKAEKGPYFWPADLHQEFMRQFSIYGKTWKIVSQNMEESGITDKDQLQCRTHGQKYLLSIEEIRESIHKGAANVASKFDKKMFQKLHRYQDDKRYLFGLYLKDQNKDWKQGQTQPFLKFQTEKAKEGFLKSIPKYI